MQATASRVLAGMLLGMMPPRLLALALASLWLMKTSSGSSLVPPPAVGPSVRKVMYYDGKTLARVEYAPDGVTLQTCRLFELDDEKEAEPIIKANGLPVQQVNFHTMLSLISRCRDLRDWTASTNNTTQWSASTIWSGIIPGTKWCGLGDIASTYNDLGTQVEVDLCCRAHDHCPVKLKAFRSGYGLVNFSLYTKSHCDCDKDFYQCLRRAKSHIADAIGNVYFNVIRVPCIRKVRTAVCSEAPGHLRKEGTCEAWAYEESGMRFVPTERKYD
ncbi:group 3 secretory phospholipase A2-like [Ornithodoros turicata]|uniref:group 3 secretory phospholipase A2-like n=1 Tax=Ornithodoros turicata TaxID=34597 RepID=UPI003138C23C